MSETKKYWIRTVIWVCPVCGKETVDRHRVTGEKPEMVKYRKLTFPDTTCHCSTEWMP